jgi:hypothetical protein
MFASPDSNCSTLCRVEKSEEESGNGMKYVWNELKPWGRERIFIGWWRTKFKFFMTFFQKIWCSKGKND